MRVSLCDTVLTLCCHPIYPLFPVLNTHKKKRTTIRTGSHIGYFFEKNTPLIFFGQSQRITRHFWFLTLTGGGRPRGNAVCKNNFLARWHLKVPGFLPVVKCVDVCVDVCLLKRLLMCAQTCVKTCAGMCTIWLSVLLIEICDLVCVLYRSAFNTNNVHTRVSIGVLLY